MKIHLNTEFILGVIQSQLVALDEFEFRFLEKIEKLNIDITIKEDEEKVKVDFSYAFKTFEKNYQFDYHFNFSDSIHCVSLKNELFVKSIYENYDDAGK